MHPVDALALTGGTATYAALKRMCGQRAIETALAGRDIQRLRRGVYALPALAGAERVAIAAGGILCLESAALHLGWGVKRVPSRPQVCFPKHRRLTPAIRSQVEVRWADLQPADVEGTATSASKTIEMSARTLAFDAALAVADSALRAGFEADLRSLRHARGRGAARIKRVVSSADGRAANPFESVLRAIALDVPGLDVRPQVWIGDIRLDLVDEALRLVVEADSFEWHGGRAALHRDANRYNALTANGWLVLRFSWEEVMLHPDRVRSVLERVVKQRADQTQARR